MWRVEGRNGGEAGRTGPGRANHTLDGCPSIRLPGEPWTIHQVLQVSVLGPIHEYEHTNMTWRWTRTWPWLRTQTSVADTEYLSRIHFFFFYPGTRIQQKKGQGKNRLTFRDIFHEYPRVQRHINVRNTYSLIQDFKCQFLPMGE